MPDPLLDLPAIGLRVAVLDSLQLRASLLELPLRPLDVDLACLAGVVDERQRAVLLDPEEPGPGCELAHVCLLEVDARRPRLEHRHQRSVASEHADLPGGAGYDDHLGLALERWALGCDKRDVEGLAAVRHGETLTPRRLRPRAPLPPRPPARRPAQPLRPPALSRLPRRSLRTCRRPAPT